MFYKRMFMRFPEGKAKVLTFSYDDGGVPDERLIKIFDKYNMKATFNLNGGLVLGAEQNGSGRMTPEKARELFENSPHEVACHGAYHTRFESQPLSVTAADIAFDRKILEEITGRIVRGMAYPFGGFSDDVFTVMKQAGLVYGRTVNSTRKFSIPIDMKKDWLELNPTCHHSQENIMEMAEDFIKLSPDQYPEMFYVWGHSTDFDIDNNWEVIEEFCEKMQNKDDIWYATNIEIYDYFDAYYNLQFSAAMTRVHNPSAIDVWFVINEKEYVVRAGQTLEIE